MHCRHLQAEHQLGDGQSQHDAAVTCSSTLELQRQAKGALSRA